jgi:hypothetical protein
MAGIRKTVFIDERRWMRGGYCAGIRRCAAGFLAESVGLLRKAAPYRPHYIDDAELLEILVQNDSGVRSEHLARLISINDDVRNADRRREELREAFRALGYRVRFIQGRRRR